MYTLVRKFKMADEADFQDIALYWDKKFSFLTSQKIFARKFLLYLLQKS